MSYDQPNLFTYCAARNICVSSHYYHQKKKNQNKTKPIKIYNTKQRNIIRFLCRKKTKTKTTNLILSKYIMWETNCK